MRYVLKNEGFPYKNIYKGRAKVGRVVKHVEGYYLGIIGPITKRGNSERTAFDAAVSADLGFDSVEELNAQNRAVRAHNRQSRAVARNTMDRLLAGDFSALDALLGKMK